MVTKRTESLRPKRSTMCGCEGRPEGARYVLQLVGAEMVSGWARRGPRSVECLKVTVAMAS
eukprot:16118603-Heterocapsa_arctica.AAC.1